MLAEQIDNDYKQAMKDRDTMKKETLSFLRAQLKNIMIDTKLKKLEDVDVIGVIKKQVKQHQDSIEQFEKGGRSDLADKEKQELVFLKGYLPQEMSEDKLKPIVDEVVKATGAAGMKDMGRVMKAVVAKVAGRADNKMVSSMVKQALS